jgi:hypothetical protein
MLMSVVRFRPWAPSDAFVARLRFCAVALRERWPKGSASTSPSSFNSRIFATRLVAMEFSELRVVCSFDMFQQGPSSDVTRTDRRMPGRKTPLPHVREIGDDRGAFKI